MKKVLSFLSALLLSAPLLAQDSVATPPRFTWSVFADVYYSYDFNQPQNHEKPFFIYNHKRHNEVALNLGLVQAAYQGEQIRGNLGLQVGNYADYNYAAEPGLLKHIYQANVGVRLSRKSALWIDAGIMPSHIGYESAISKDNWAFTRSLMAENSPYFETGAKLSYTTPNGQWFLSGLVLNGWQRIQRIDGNNTPAFGTQLTYTPSAKALFNWSTYVGNEYPDSAKRWRFFNNFYTVLQPTDKWGITLAFDIGSEQKAPGNEGHSIWYTPNAVVRYTPNDRWAFAARAEYYRDADGVIMGTPDFKVWGASVNVDRKIGDHCWWRTEFRNLGSPNPLFLRKGTPVDNEPVATTSLAISF